MLRQLYLRNYALFSETRIEFRAGLNILTGETGAGKSLLVGALGLILGRRLDNSMIFVRDEKCIIEAHFGGLAAPILARLRQIEDLELEDDELIVRREVTAAGKSRAFINDTPVSLQILREATSLLIDMHGQHDNMALLEPQYQLELLDEFADAHELRAAFGQQLKVCDQTLRQIRDLEVREADAKRQLEYIRFQVQDLQSADLKADEEEQLEQELNLLQNSEDVRDALGGGVDLLYQQETALYAQFSQLLDSLKKIADVNQQLREDVSRIYDMRESCKEIAFTFQRLLDTVESDPERLAFIEERLAIYHKLKLKYGARTGADLVALLARLQGELDSIGSIEDTIRQLYKTYQAQQNTLRETGLQLDAARKAAKPLLETGINQLLQQVGFQKARFEVAIEWTEDPQGSLDIPDYRVRPMPSGLNKVYFLIQTNPGMPGGPLSQIASGGEISRVMLAIKAVLAEKAAFPVMIFDEIDTGISGETANKVGTVMQQLAQRFQLISITHLPQIAAKGHEHFRISKKVMGDATVSYVARLDRDSRIRALAEMISGDQPTDSALRNAEELMAAG
ncbi:MAG: DNA repair protein RecN [Bacteroidia bacterium]|nr:DNA repair protein RecN [Bacteroidia bacterium]